MKLLKDSTSTNPLPILLDLGTGTNLIICLFLFLCIGCITDPERVDHGAVRHLVVKSHANQIEIHYQESDKAIITQVTKADFRPYIHPILTPNTHLPLTEYSPGHHKHQTGLYWGFTRVNGSGIDDENLNKWFYRKDKPPYIADQIGRDYFHNPGETHWRKVGQTILIGQGPQVKWQTTYHQLDALGNPVLLETQTWTFQEDENRYVLDLEWEGEALVDVIINKFDYGGLFLRMPWNKDITGRAVNNARQQNGRAEGQRAMWLDVGMEIEGSNEWGHIALFDHPDNPGFPQYWRVDGQLGVGPVPSREKDISIPLGQHLTYRHRMVAYTGQLQDVLMDSLWADYIDDDGVYNTAALWDVAREEGKNAKLLTPSEAVEEMILHQDFKVNAYAAEPMITQPMAFCWDDRGRMWVAENRDYESRGKGFSNSGDSRILILEDTDRDGSADKQTVFLEGIPFPAAIAVGFDGLFLGAPPNLLFVPDRNRDDRADLEDIEVKLTGWGIRDRHETINSFHWGPDGWLYGLEGFATPSKIRKPQGKGIIYQHRDPFPDDLLEADGVDINGGVWRYHPVKERFEVVAHGFSNPWGIDYDAKGQLFITACVIPHMFHVIPGGIYHRQGGSHYNPYVFQDIQTIVDHRHRSAHGGARVYLSDAFPSEHHGRLFMANIHEHAVLSDVLIPSGSGFIASHGDDFLHANNAQWIGFSMELGPGGNLYVLDWHDADICGQEVLNKETGRIYRIAPKHSLSDSWAGRYTDLSSWSDLRLAELQTSKSSWHARRARVILQHRASQNSLHADAIDKLHEILASSSVDHRLQAMWTLFISGHLNRNELMELISDPEPYVRAWAIQFLGEDRDLSTNEITAFIKRAEHEDSPVVRLYLAAVSQRIPLSQRWDLVESLIVFSEDARDPNIPHMLWFAIEPLVERDPQRALHLAEKCNIPLIAENIGRRIVYTDKLSDLIANLTNNDKSALNLGKGLLAGLEGRGSVQPPDNWEEVYKKIRNRAALTDLSTRIAQFFW